MKPLPATLVFCAVLLLSGCGEPKADVLSPRRYDKGGLTFLYPGNWKIDEDQEMGGIHHLSIETPGNALVILQMFPMANAKPLEKYAARFSELTAGALPLGKITSSKFSPLTVAEGYSRLQEIYNIRVLNEDTPHVRHYLSRDFGAWRCYVVCQVAEEDLKKVEEGFKQVVASLLFEPPAASKTP